MRQWKKPALITNLFAKCPGRNFFKGLVVKEGDTYTLRLTKKSLRICIIVFAIIIILALSLGVWGIMRESELIQLQRQTQLQSEQLKLLDQKANILDKKLKTLDQLGQQVKQMIKGAESGNLPNESGSQAKDKGSSTSSASNSDEADPVTPTQLSALFSVLDRRAQTELIQFYMWRAMLQDGMSQSIQNMQSAVFSAGNPNAANSTVPSIWPAKGEITSPFGYRIDPVYGGGAFHEGVDIANDMGTPIVATASGVVSFAGPTSGGYGNLVEIDHGNGIVTRYGHTSVILVHAGQHVNQGETIALMGSTGKSTGSHVHYEVDVNGQATDPMVFLPLTN